MLAAIVLIVFAAIVKKGLLVKPIPNEDSKRNPLERTALPVKNADWLGTPTGEWTVAIGLVAIAVSLFAFTVQDVSVLLTGDLFRLALLRSVWYLLWAGLATLFSAVCVFILRPALPRIVIALFSVAMASHIVEKFVRMPAPQLRLVALCRLFVSLGVVLVYLRHRFDEPETLN
jgi:uncharacterized protein YjeT (DUF2065 family)